MATKSKIKLSADTIKRMKNRPYYAFLYAKNILNERLPECLEEVFIKDSHSAYLYAKHVIKGKLPDFIRASFILCEPADDESKEYITRYIKEFCE